MALSMAYRGLPTAVTLKAFSRFLPVNPADQSTRRVALASWSYVHSSVMHDLKSRYNLIETAAVLTAPLEQLAITLWKHSSILFQR